MALATGLGVGFVPVAPGTFGSALAIPIFVLFSPLGLPLGALTWTALLCLGVWAATGAEAAFGREDDGRIVIDEVVGQLLTLGPLSLVRGAGTPFWLVTAFVLFRVFDIWKPGPVRWAERRWKGGLGVMMDDVVAGALGAVVLGLLLAAAGAWGGMEPA